MGCVSALRAWLGWGVVYVSLRFLELKRMGQGKVIPLADIHGFGMHSRTSERIFKRFGFLRCFRSCESIMSIFIHPP